MPLNLTQHAATLEQIAAGVVDLDAETRAAVSNALTFDTQPTREEIAERARWLGRIAAKKCRPDGLVMIGGAPWLMSRLERELISRGLLPVYAFSKRESVDVQKPDGSLHKMAIFRHTGWVPAV